MHGSEAAHSPFLLVSCKCCGTGIQGCLPSVTVGVICEQCKARGGAHPPHLSLSHRSDTGLVGKILIIFNCNESHMSPAQRKCVSFSVKF